MVQNLAAVLALTVTGVDRLPQFPDTDSWHRYESAHVVLTTNLGPDSARQVLRRMEQLRAGLVATFGEPPHTRPGQRLEVTAFADALELTHALGREPYATAFFLHDGHPTLVVGGPPSSWEAVFGPISAVQRGSPLSWGLASGLVDSLFDGAEVPLWVRSGLMDHLATLKFNDDGSQAALTDSVRLNEYFSHRTVGLDDLWSWPDTESQSQRRAYQGAAYGLIRWALRDQPRAFHAFVAGVRAGVPARQAWNTAFAALTPKQVDVAAYRAARFELSPLRAVAVTMPQLAVKVAALTDAEVTALLELTREQSSRPTRLFDQTEFTPVEPRVRARR